MNRRKFLQVASMGALVGLIGGMIGLRKKGDKCEPDMCPQAEVPPDTLTKGLILTGGIIELESKPSSTAKRIMVREWTKATFKYRANDQDITQMVYWE